MTDYYYDDTQGSPMEKRGRQIYLDALGHRRGFRPDQLGIEDDEIWSEIFEAIGEAAAATE